MKDAYGNPVRLDEYGNLVRDPLPQDTEHQQQQHHGISGILHGSGSSSSSSSEDEGHAGARKKEGVKEKVKEKITGSGHKGNEPHAINPGGAYDLPHYGEEQHGKKGITDKINEKLPGSTFH